MLSHAIHGEAKNAGLSHPDSAPVAAGQSGIPSVTCRSSSCGNRTEHHGQRENDAKIFAADLISAAPVKRDRIFKHRACKIMLPGRFNKVVNKPMRLLAVEARAIERAGFQSGDAM
jgi:hypothetical protein